MLGAPLAEPPDGAAERARIVVDRPERVEVETHVDAAGLLVLTDTYYPGWRATVDGTPATIVRSDHAFRGVRVEPGDHHVVFTYAPRTVVLGGVCSAAAALVVVACLFPRRRPRRG